MRIAITGSSGLIGGALTEFLLSKGHEVIRVVRYRSADVNAIYWSPDKGMLESKKLRHVDAIVNLAGASIFGRWNEEKKLKILESRVKGTKLLAEVISELAQRPKVLVNASATGYYGERGSELLDESAQPGNLFLSRVCVEWEAATKRAEDAGIRTVKLRMGLVITRRGGVVNAMKRLLSMGLALPSELRSSYVSWIALGDLVRAILYTIENDEIAGPVNACSPNPVEFGELEDAVMEITGKRPILRLPKRLLRLLMGEAAEELFASVRAYPAKLLSKGFEFKFKEIREAAKRG